MRAAIYGLCAATLLGALLSAAVSADAVAQSCRGLAAQYATLTKSINRAGSSRYTKAYRQQSRQLESARAEYRSAGCRGLFGHSQNGWCVQRRNRISSMESNLAALARKGGGGTAGLERQRSAIDTRMRRNNCGNIRVAAQQPGSDRKRSSSRTAKRSGAIRGTHRTLCVRACDGYYFPISYSTTQRYFQQDLARCQQVCPSAQVDLYVHRNPGEGPEEMVSLSGLDYTSLETAFLYRKQRVDNCTCRAATAAGASLQEISAGMRTGIVDIAPQSSGGLSAVPTNRLPADEDPETIANLRGNLDPVGVTSTVLNREPSAEADAGEIRIVGPKFYADR